MLVWSTFSMWPWLLRLLLYATFKLGVGTDTHIFASGKKKCIHKVTDEVTTNGERETTRKSTGRLAFIFPPPGRAARRLPSETISSWAAELWDQADSEHSHQNCWVCRIEGGCPGGLKHLQAAPHESSSWGASPWRGIPGRQHVYDISHLSHCPLLMRHTRAQTPGTVPLQSEAQCSDPFFQGNQDSCVQGSRAHRGTVSEQEAHSERAAPRLYCKANGWYNKHPGFFLLKRQLSAWIVQIINFSKPWNISCKQKNMCNYIYTHMYFT